MPRRVPEPAGAVRAPRIERPLCTVDVVVFTVRDEQLCALLVQRPDAPDEPFPRRWALPGGFVDPKADASLEACAQRKLAEKTGVVPPYLEQLGSWGDGRRDPRGWSATHVYFTLMPTTDVVLTAGGNAGEAKWLPVDPPSRWPALAFDHRRILEAAVERLRSKVEYTSLAAYLLPDEFTLTELQRRFEVVLGRAIEKSAFRTRMLSVDWLEPLAAMRTGNFRPAQLYRLKAPGELVFFPRTFYAKDGR
ncbi:NUDIX hydrolase [Caldimonas sp. KR1-144]|uniref:NUDIX hydrolase n=1 Tax=Caldimonas sp. KR1-144 TaxID=3400911 RepID=UPI003C0BF8D0